MYLKVVDNPNLVRDSKTNAVLSTDNTGLEAYKTRKKQFNKINMIEETVKTFDERLSSIERLLSSLNEKLINDPAVR
jgi:hypothetical protein